MSDPTEHDQPTTPVAPSATPDEDPHEGLQAICANKSIWWRYSGVDLWFAKSPEDALLMIAAFEEVPPEDWQYKSAQTLIKQLRNALEAYRKDNP